MHPHRNMDPLGAMRPMDPLGAMRPMDPLGAMRPMGPLGAMLTRSGSGFKTPRAVAEQTLTPGRGQRYRPGD